MTVNPNVRPGIRLIETEGLVQPEGVNAGSAVSATESAANALKGDVTRGGRPDAAAEQVDVADERAQIVNSPWGRLDPDAPSVELSEEKPGGGG